MSPETIGWIAIAALFILLALRIPIAIVLGVVGFIGYIAISGLAPALRIVGAIPFSKVATYTFSVIPLFYIMGFFAHHAGLTAGLFDTAQAWFGRIKGGLAQATVVGAAAFAAACGSGPASCAVIAKITIPQMIRVGVQPRLAFGTVAAAATLAQMIPPSVLMVIFGVIAEVSVGKLLVAGIIPGIVAAIIYMISIYIRVSLNPSLAPMAPPTSFKTKLISLKGGWGVLVLFVLVMGGIYTGIFTPTEAGGVGAFGAFVMALTIKKMKWPQIRECLYDTVRNQGMILLIVANAFIFGYLLSITGIPSKVSSFLTTLQVPTMVILIGIMIMYLILGFFLDMIAAMFITLPVILPALHALDVNLIWFGVLLVHMCEIALYTPPFAINLFVLQGLFPEHKMSEITNGIWPFLVTDLVTLAIFLAFPQLATFLPDLMWAAK